MRPADVEAWALRVADRVGGGARVEDSLVELKAIWPADAYKAARQLAGHCNAAAGDIVLWVIGLDEKRGAVGVAGDDLADWWPQILVHCDKPAPALVGHVVVSFGDVELVALAFETDRAPYVVRNPDYGRTKGVLIEREVPWRAGTAVRSAKREDLVRLLVPAQPLPTATAMSARISIHDRTSKDGQVEWSWVVRMYVVAPVGVSVVLPTHQAEGALWLPGYRRTFALTPWLTGGDSRGPTFGQHRNPDDRLHFVRTGTEQVIIEGPGFMTATGHLNTKAMPPRLEELQTAKIRLRMLPVGSDRAVTVEQELERSSRPDDDSGYPSARRHAVWRFGEET